MLFFSIKKKCFCSHRIICSYYRPTRGAVPSMTDNIKMSMRPWCFWISSIWQYLLNGWFISCERPLLMFIVNAFWSELRNITPLAPVKPERTRGGRAPLHWHRHRFFSLSHPSTFSSPLQTNRLWPTFTLPRSRFKPLTQNKQSSVWVQHTPASTPPAEICLSTASLLPLSGRKRGFHMV